MFYTRNLSKGFELKCSCIPIRHSKCHHNSKCGARGVYIHQAASSYSTWFNCLLMFRSVSQVVLDVSMAMRWVSPASRAIAAQETVAKVLSAALQPPVTELQVPCIAGWVLDIAGYCRILLDIAGYCWIVFLVFVFYLVLPAISSNIQHHSTKNNPNDHFAIACRQVEGWQLLRGPLAIQWVATPRALAIQWIATPRGRDRCGHPQRFWWRPSMKSFHVVKPKKSIPTMTRKLHKWVIWTIH